MQVRVHIAGALLARVRACGGDADGLIRTYQLPADVEQVPEIQLPLRTFYAFQEAAAAEAQDPDIGLHLAEEFERGSFGIGEFVVRSAPTVAEAFDRLVRYVRLLNDRVEMSLDQKANAVRLEAWIRGQPAALGRHGNEFFLALMALQVARFTVPPSTALEVTFAHPAPGHGLGEHHRIFGKARLVFGEERNALTLDRVTFGTPISSADPPLLSVLERQAAELLKARPTPNPWLNTLNEEIRRSLGEAPLTLTRVASRLKMSPRTLQRRLATEKTTFAEIVDGIRCDVAKAEVSAARLPLGEISYRLGYGELSSFLRAFRRWTGVTPARFRASHRAK